MSCPFRVQVQLFGTISTTGFNYLPLLDIKGIPDLVNMSSLPTRKLGFSDSFRTSPQLTKGKRHPFWTSKETTRRILKFPATRCGQPRFKSTASTPQPTMLRNTHTHTSSVGCPSGVHKTNPNRVLSPKESHFRTSEVWGQLRKLQKHTCEKATRI